jgi:hypothetical protein
VCGEWFSTQNSVKRYCSRTCQVGRKNLERKTINNGRVNGIPTGTVGAISELMACVDLMNKGYEVFRAMSPSSNCDLIGIKNEVIHKYEVRTGNYEKTADGLKLSWSNQRSSGKEMLVITYKDNKVHHIPTIIHDIVIGASVYCNSDGSYSPFIHKASRTKLNPITPKAVR